MYKEFSALVVSNMLSWYLFIFVSPMYSLCFSALLRCLWKIAIYYGLVFYIFFYSMIFTIFKALWWPTAAYIHVYWSMLDIVVSLAVIPHFPIFILLTLSTPTGSTNTRANPTTRPSTTILTIPVSLWHNFSISIWYVRIMKIMRIVRIIRVIRVFRTEMSPWFASNCGSVYCTLIWGHVYHCCVNTHFLFPWKYS